MILLAVDGRRVLAESATYAPHLPQADATTRFTRALTAMWNRAGKQAELAHVVVVTVQDAEQRYPAAVAAWRSPAWRAAWSAWPTADLLPLQQPQEYRAEHPAA